MVVPAAARDQVQRALWSLLWAYGALLGGPASQMYAQVDSWQDLGSIARSIRHDAAGKPLILFAPDETTRAIIDLYARTTVVLIPGPIDADAIDRLKGAAAAAPQSLVVVQLPARARTLTQGLAQRVGLAQHFWPARPPPAASPDALSVPAWAIAARLRLAKSYSLPNGRSYALLELQR